MMKRRLTSCLLLALVHSSAGVAASLDLHWDANPYNPASPTDTINYNLTSPASSGSILPDRYHGTATNLSGITESDLIDGTNGSIFTYCYEITQFYSPGSTVHYTLDSSAVTAATLDFLGAVDQVLSNNTNPYAWLNPINAYQIDATHSISAVNIAAAIQIGIWETKYDGSFNLTGGAFTVSNLDSATQTALSMFQNAMPGSGSLGSQYVTVLTNNTAQDQITGVRTVGRLLPEPGTLALLGVALAGVVLTQRRSRTDKR